MLIVSAINPSGSHKRGTRRPTWALVDSQRHVFTENARAFAHARADPVTVACSSYYDWNILKQNIMAKVLIRIFRRFRSPIFGLLKLLAASHTFWNQQLVFCHRPTAIKNCWHVLNHWMLKLPTFLTTLNIPVKLLNPAINISQFDSVVCNGHIGLLAALFRLNRH